MPSTEVTSYKPTDPLDAHLHYFWIADHSSRTDDSLRDRSFPGWRSPTFTDTCPLIRLPGQLPNFQAKRYVAGVIPREHL